MKFALQWLAVVQFLTGYSSSDIANSDQSLPPLLNETVTVEIQPTQSSNSTDTPLTTTSEPAEPTFKVSVGTQTEKRVIDMTRPGVCVSEGTTDVPVFLWVEMPRQVRRTEATMKRFYSRIVQFVRDNCLKAKVTQMIIRVETPYTECEGRPVYQDPANSPLYRYLLRKLPPDMSLRFYPYLGPEEGSAHYQNMWAEYMHQPNSKFLRGVYKFVRMWNKALRKLDSPVTFSGITMDMEEGIELNRDAILRLKAEFPDIPYLGISVGFDDVNWIYRYHAIVDEYYMQMYDYYAKDGGAPICLSAQTSPFVLHQDKPDAVYDWITEYVTKSLGSVGDLYASRFTSKMFLMWSSQNVGSDQCLYPLNGLCGHSYDFGTWTAESFNSFLSQVTGPESVFANFGGHGIYEFAFLQRDWYIHSL